MAVRTKWPLALALTGLLAAGLACQPKVLVMGNSITALSRENVVESWRGSGYGPSFIAIATTGGCPIVQGHEPWVERIQSVLTRREIEGVIVELGTNDVQTNQVDCINDYANQAMAPVVDGLPRIPVFWLTVREDIKPPLSATLNSELREATARWPNVGILDYDGHFRPRCSDWCDGVHLNEAGQSEYARWLVRGLAAVSCGKFQYQEKAQTHLSRHPDATSLDGDRDGFACEGLRHQPPPCAVARPGLAKGDMPAVMRRGTWLVRESYTTGEVDVCFNFGDLADAPLTGDWDGNGTKTPGVFRNGTWYLRNSNTTGNADIVMQFGDAGDVPEAGDWNHDGTDTPAVFRSGHWYLRNSNVSGVAEESFAFGNPTDTPVVGDWNHDGTDTPGVFRSGVWYLTNAFDQGSAEGVFAYGSPGDQPVAGDWNKDGTDTLAVVRRGTWYLTNVFDRGRAELLFNFGTASDVPGTLG
jgi:hypothetical protein